MKIKELFEASTTRKHLTEMPTSEFNSYSVQFDFKEQTTLKDIHKLVKCKRLVINGCGNVTGNVLGLLSMDLLQLSFIGIPDNKSRMWTNIVIKHFYDDKDILECQEELIANGLRQYAKF